MTVEFHTSFKFALSSMPPAGGGFCCSAFPDVEASRSLEAVTVAAASAAHEVITSGYRKLARYRILGLTLLSLQDSSPLFRQADGKELCPGFSLVSSFRWERRETGGRELRPETETRESEKEIEIKKRGKETVRKTL